jgi:hypothetical protein
MGDSVVESDEELKKKLREKILEGEVLRWDVEAEDGGFDFKNEHLGYFGAIDIMSVGGKKTIIECDPRDAILRPMLAEWYDDVMWITGGKWSPDTRFVSDPNRIPAIVRKDGKFAMVGYYGQTVRRGNRYLRLPYYDRWYDAIGTVERRMKFGDTWVSVFDAVKDGKSVMLTNKGVEISIDVNLTLERVKDWSKDDILHQWIEADRPCTLIYGFAYKGAKPHLIKKEEALKRIKTHSFGIGYYSMEWTVFDGMAVLQFSEYSESDMM